MQPTYMPWAGFFALIGACDRFIYLDDAQYERGTWHQRNRVLLRGEPHWLTVPVVRRALGDAISAVTVDDKHNWRRKHLALISETYAHHPFRADALELGAIIQDTSLQILASLNIALIEHCCQRLGIATARERSSAMNVPGKRTDRVIALCQAIGADVYLSPPGAREYLETDGFRQQAALRLDFFVFDATPYPQRGTSTFVSRLSILDVVANLGWQGAAQYVRGPGGPVT